MTEVNNNSTPMQTAQGDIPVERIPMSESFSSELPQQYIAKGQTSFQQSSFLIPPNVDGAVLNHMRVAMATSANAVDRQRSLDQLRRMCAAGDEQAKAALEAMSGLVIN